MYYIVGTVSGFLNDCQNPIMQFLIIKIADKQESVIANYKLFHLLCISKYFQMKKEKDYIGEIAQIRAMMERSSKFLSLSGWAGIMAGIYALAGAWVAWKIAGLNTSGWSYSALGKNGPAFEYSNTILIFTAVLVLATGTAAFDSLRKARRRNEQAWNATSRRLLKDMAVPLATGGMVAVILMLKGALALIAPVTLIFYGLALYNAGRYTYREVRALGIVELILGLAAFWFVQYGLLLWVAGFGAANIIYGVTMHFR